MGLWKHASAILNRWFKDNLFKINPGKCHFLFYNHPKEVSIILENEIINNSNSVKLLGVTIDKKLYCNKHVTELCKKANQKIHALARISNYMNKDKLKLILKSFIESQFGYCPLVWMFHSRKLNNRINRLHESGLRLVYKDQKHTLMNFYVRITPLLSTIGIYKNWL